MNNDLKRAIEAGASILKGAKSASYLLEKIKSSTLFGITGGLAALCLVDLLHELARLPLWPALPLLFALGIAVGHIIFRSLRGFRWEAKAEQDRALFDEGVRRLKALKALMPPEHYDAAWDRLVRDTASTSVLTQLLPSNQSVSKQLPPS